ncbi:hypothetical protein K492DRAFT_38521 [Lichtheimia hyalospora FSU 10163]|nr:hypothetical protein K492DRAFT_38521 [Lichtheimia hyalospora FSU 10163]
MTIERDGVTHHFTPTHFFLYHNSLIAYSSVSMVLVDWFATWPWNGMLEATLIFVVYS